MKLTVAAAAVVAGLAAASPANAECFLKLEGVKGESTDAKHAGEIDVLAWSWGVTQPGGSSVAGGASASRPNVGDIKLSKALDSASTALAMSGVLGKPFRSAVLSCRKSGRSQAEFVTITLGEVYVSAFALSTTSQVPQEELSLSFRTIKIEYRPSRPDGSLGDSTSFSWDTIARKPG